VSTSNIIRIVQLAVIVAVAAFAISVVVAGHWWSPPPKQIDLADLGRQVTSGLQHPFDTAGNAQEYGLQVVANDIILINVTGNQYQGLVTVRTRKSTQVPVGVILYADGTNMIYQIDPQSAIKLTQAAEKDKDPMKQTCWGPQC
jgi:hypothetical protein